jgi:competence protein ComEC
VLLAVFLLARERQTLLLLGCAVVGLCIAMLASWSEPLLDNYRVTVLDVGKGQCVLLQSEGKTYMVDCGSDYSKNAANKAAATLLSQGVTKLDGLILTHYDEDHVGGAAMLLSRIPADLLVLPEGTGAEEFESDILAVCNGTVLRGDEDLRIAWGDAWIRIYASFDTETTNESSLCVLFHTEKCDILITGDRSMVGESFLLRTAALPQLDALVVGHHGSADSTGEALLAATRPAAAVISVGEGNRYGHPSREVLERLATYGCVIRRTDREGTIILRG